MRKQNLQYFLNSVENIGICFIKMRHNIEKYGVRITKALVISFFLK